ncbi:hypothetical protein [Helicobacter pylori]|uniref:hypothetical protein n=1 Tax=Helicobacter pylori TaxID=210 RepID=UPI001F3AA336|nr:hypothetical protein [Helicobacter pylori]
MSENEELELGAKVAELDKRAAELDERENRLNEIQEQLRKNIDAFKQEKEVYLKNQKEFGDFMEDKEVFKKEQVQKVKESLRTYEKEQKELILETIGKQLQEQQESLNKDYGRKLESIKEHSDRLENDLKTQFDAQLERWEQNFKGYEQQLTDILNDKAQLDLDKERFNAQKQGLENHIKQREEEIREENQNEIVRLKEEKNGLHRQLDEMANETSALRQKNRELNKKIDWQKDYDMEKLEKDNRDLEKCKKDLLAANENLKNRIQELENEKNKLDPRDERMKNHTA